jgi:hypothetical protein
MDFSTDSQGSQHGPRARQLVAPSKLQKDPNTPTWDNRGPPRVEVDSSEDLVLPASAESRQRIESLLKRG